MEGCFAENRNIFFSGKCLEKRSCDILENRCLRENVTFGKVVSITQQTVDYAVSLVNLVTLCCSLLGFADPGLC